MATAPAAQGMIGARSLLAMPNTKPPVARPSSRADLRIDLNLFRVLDAIHTHGGISAAARALHLSQPAISHALNRLREQFGDPLFVRQGNQMQPTERTRRVMAQVQEHLRGLAAVVKDVRSFDPAALEINFEIAVRDVLESITFPRLMQYIVQTAPGVTISSRRVPRQQLERELVQGQIDLAIERETRMGSRIRSQKLAEETLVVVGPKKGARRPAVLSMDEYLQARHVHVTLSPEREDALERLLLTQGRQRHVALRCQHYFAACQVVAQTGWLLTMPRTYALELAGVLPLTIYPTPFPVPPIAFLMYWHADRDEDPAHRWLRELVAAGAPVALGKPPRRRNVAR